MCYKVSTPKQYLAEQAYDYAVTYQDWNSTHELANGFGNPLLPSIIYHKEQFRFIDFEFGLLPKSYSNFEGIRKLRSGTINAKSETCFTTYSFKESILSRRCLIIIDGFYEGHKLNKTTSIPHFITLKDREIFALAGIWDTWKHPGTGEVIRSCSILTTIANPLLARIHNKVDENGNPDPRMPVILSKEDEKAWLDPTLKIEDIKAFFKPYPEELMKAHTVSKLANAQKENNVPEVKLPFDYSSIGYSLSINP